MPVMAYSPIAQAGTLRRGLFENQMVKELAEKYGVNPAFPSENGGEGCLIVRFCTLLYVFVPLIGT